MLLQIAGIEVVGAPFLSEANSFSCCFFRKLWAVAVTIFMKKFISTSHTTVFQTEANDKSHFFTWKKAADKEMKNSCKHERHAHIFERIRMRNMFETAKNTAPTRKTLRLPPSYNDALEHIPWYFQCVIASSVEHFKEYICPGLVWNFKLIFGLKTWGKIQKYLKSHFVWLKLL